MLGMINFSNYVWGQGPSNPTITALNPPNLGAGSICGQNLFPFWNLDSVQYDCYSGGSGNLLPQAVASFCGQDVCCMGWVTSFSGSVSEITPDDAELQSNGDTGCDLSYGIGWEPFSYPKAVGLVTAAGLMEAFRMPLYNDVQLVPGAKYRLRFKANELCGVSCKINIFGTETPPTGCSNLQPQIPTQIQNLPPHFTCTSNGLVIKAFPIGEVTLNPGTSNNDYETYELLFTVPINFTGNAKELVFYISNDGLQTLGRNRFSVALDDFELYLEQKPFDISGLYIDYICQKMWFIQVETGGFSGTPPYNVEIIVTENNNPCTTQFISQTLNFPIITCLNQLPSSFYKIIINITDACGNKATYTQVYPRLTENCCNNPDITFTNFNVPTVPTTFTNKKIRFLGTVDIYPRFTFNNCEIYMGNNALLRFYDHLTLNNTTITICPQSIPTYFWDAIEMVGNNKVLTINNNNTIDDYIELAKRGIVIRGNNRLVANRAVFKNNLTSITNYANNGLNIIRSKFYGFENYTLPITGILNYGNDVLIGTLLGNNNNRNSFEGFNVQYSQAILQKGAINFTVLNNNFLNCYQGVHGVDATGVCNGNNFKNPIDSLTIGIRLRNSNLTTNNNNFEDLHFGIVAEGIGIFNFDNDKHKRMKIAGVYILGEAIQAEIKNCTLNTNVLNNALGIGIFETDFANAVPNAVKIFNNSMGGVGTGIHLFQLNNPEIYENTINLSGITSPFANLSRGAVNLMSCSYPWVYTNTLSSQSSSLDNQTHGIFAEETDNLIVFNNTFKSKLYNGISLLGKSVAGPKYACNNFDKVNTAMVFKDNGSSLIGNNFFFNQYPTMNRFRNVNVHSLASGSPPNVTQLSDSVAVPYAFYYYRNLTSGGWTEYPSNNQGMYPLLPQLTSNSTPFTCSSQTGNKALNHEVAIEPILTDKDWENKLKLMAEIIADTSLLQDPIYAQFYQDYQNHNIYAFALAQKYTTTDTALSNQILNQTVPTTTVEVRYKKLKQIIRKQQWTAQDSLDIQQIAHQPFEEGIHKYLAAFVELLQNPNPQQHAGVWVPAIEVNTEQLQRPSTVTFVEEEIAHQVYIYPNPTEGTINIEGMEWKYAEIYDMLGKKLKICQDYVDISELNDGVYILKLYDDKGLVLVHKIVKQ
ncbi:MAG: hypothetical protein KatS3mg035_1369 [Bacteroidia bacterium]|nr:MAG: hypothetical protein KatS3mg035_1369 [Bacteroidia bacterium]